MDLLEAVIAAILIRAIDVVAYLLGCMLLAAGVFALACGIHYVLRWSDAFKKPPAA